ncbi:hypothetical protein Y5A_019440 [Burkholderia glumae AU6208]|nr:hypothetical protein Y5A_019440 [Burkholderia glumae AU6208]
MAAAAARAGACAAVRLPVSSEALARDAAPEIARVLALALAGEQAASGWPRVAVHLAAAAAACHTTALSTA